MVVSDRTTLFVRRLAVAPAARGAIWESPVPYIDQDGLRMCRGKPLFRVDATNKGDARVQKRTRGVAAQARVSSRRASIGQTTA
jgi:hypothetical protein